MTIARRKQFCPELTPYYHCVSRCVRRSFLCGKDKLTRKDFSHRRGWIEQHLLLLSEVFCIDIAAYAIMSNHYHVVLMVNQAKLDALSDDHVIERWRRLYKGPEVVQRYLDGEVLTGIEIQQLKETVAQWRNHMINISRFMGNLNQTIARWANKEDKCKGRFWEGRFKMQALLDSAALLAAMCYVDLNPVRAKIAKTPETSPYTSIWKRLHAKDCGLMPFTNEDKQDAAQSKRTELPINFKDYLVLLDCTGRVIKKGKHGSISPTADPILERLGYTSDRWVKAQKPEHSWVQKATGNIDAIKEYCKAMGQRWIWQQQ